MAVLIDMEIPESCFLCRFCRRQEYGEYYGEDTAWSCVASEKRITDGLDLIATFKHPDCPLVEAAEVQDAVSRQAVAGACMDVTTRIVERRYPGMRRAIYEDDVIKLLDRGWKSGVYPVASNVHALPSAQPKLGHWTESHEHIYMGNTVKEWTNWYCSECDAPNDKPTDFCPHCGADMRGEEMSRNES